MFASSLLYRQKRMVGPCIGPTIRKIILRPFSARHEPICMHPDSISKEVLSPGDVVLFKRKDGSFTTRYVEIAHGYFWMIKDLRRTNEQPVLPTFIKEKQALPFPTLVGAQSLDGDTANFPDFFLRRNRSNDPHAQCTLVAISFRQFGLDQVSSWVDPFRKAFASKDRVDVVQLNVSHGWFNRYFLKPIIVRSSKKNVPLEFHSSTFLYFQNSDDMRNALRMHNVLVGYVFLLDGRGRVRFAASGTAQEEDVDKLIAYANDLTPHQMNARQKKSFARKRGGGGFKRNRNDHH